MSPTSQPWQLQRAAPAQQAALQTTRATGLQAEKGILWTWTLPCRGYRRWVQGWMRLGPGCSSN